MPGGMVVVVKVDVKAFRDVMDKELLDDLFDGMELDGAAELLVENGIDPLQAFDQIVAVMDEHRRSFLFASGPGLPDKLRAALEKDKPRNRIVRENNMVKSLEGDNDIEKMFGVYGNTVVTTEDLIEEQYRPLFPGQGVARDAILARALNRIDTGAPAFAVYADRVDVYDPLDLRADKTNQLTYAVGELKGSSTLALRLIAVVEDPAALVRAADNEDLKRIAARNGVTYKFASDGKAAELSVTFSRGQARKTFSEFAYWLPRSGGVRLADQAQSGQPSESL